jgi:hypothetical protein
MTLAFLVALVLAAGVLGGRGADENSLKAALFITARWSFLFFFLAYAGGALYRLSGSRFAYLKRGREYGLAFASAHLVHLGLVAWLWALLHHAPLPAFGVGFFGVAVAFTYLMAALSFGPWSAAMRHPGVRLLILLGLNYILLAFASDFLRGAATAMGPKGSPRQMLEYLPFAALCLIAPLLRLAAASLKKPQHAAAE